MKINATLPEKGRDLRLDLFRGVANWAIYLDHIPDNVVNWITTRNYGFSDAADLFVFISGYTASFVYARMMLELVGKTASPATQGMTLLGLANLLPTNGEGLLARNPRWCG